MYAWWLSGVIFIYFISRIACHHYTTKPYFYYLKSFESDEIWSQRVYSHSRKVCHCNSSWHLLKVLVWRLEVKKKPSGLVLYSDIAVVIKKKKLTRQWLCREERVRFSSRCHHNWEVRVAGPKTFSDVTPTSGRQGLTHIKNPEQCLVRSLSLLLHSPGPKLREWSCPQWVGLPSSVYPIKEQSVVGVPIVQPDLAVSCWNSLGCVRLTIRANRRLEGAG